MRYLRYPSASVLCLVTGSLVACLIATVSAATFVALHSSPSSPMLDRSRLGPDLFSEHFDVGLSLYDENSHIGRWRTQYGYGSVDSQASRTHGELQCYVDPSFAQLGLQPFLLSRDPAEGSILSIRMDKASSVVQRTCYGSAYTSGMLSSQLSFAMNDGYWEIRAKMPPAGSGVWPAIWLLPKSGAWPPEIDILEMARGVLFCTLHSKITGQHVIDAKSFPALGDLSSQYHTFGLLKTGTDVIWYVDNREVRRAPASADLDQPFFLIINLAMGSSHWVGRPGPDSTPATLGIASIKGYALR